MKCTDRRKSKDRAISKVNSTTEYEALRAEKLFRYEYSNQLNISLLTFAFTVFTAGLLIFSILMEIGKDKITPTNIQDDTQTYMVFVEYFFACFFLIPCFFSGINFRYTVKNSLRIGQITEYIREKVHFDDGESWESFKRKYHVNYFYKKPSGIGGARDIPLWINIISCAMSLIIGIFGIVVIDINTRKFLTDNTWWVAFYCLGVALLLIMYKFLQPIIPVKHQWWVQLIILAKALIPLFICYFKSKDEMLVQKIIISVWLALLYLCIIITPRYAREIELANCVLEYTKEKLKHANNAKKEITFATKKNIFHQFLLHSTIIQKYREKKCILRWYYRKYCREILITLEIDSSGKCTEKFIKYIDDCLTDIFP